MSHILKVLLKIVLQQVRRKIRLEIPENQFGFMGDWGTRNAVFILKMLSERAIQHRRDVSKVFTDLGDIQRWPSTRSDIKIFSRCWRKYKLMTKIYVSSETYYNKHLAAVCVPEKSTTAWARIRRGVRQGCVMSPDLFNLYSEMIHRELEDVDEGIVVNGVRINNIRYADDTVSIAPSPEGLQRFSTSRLMHVENRA